MTQYAALLYSRDVDWTRPEYIVTNGPYVLGSWTPGKTIILERNPFYYGHFPGNVNQVEIHLDANLSPTDRMALYESDQLDLQGITPQIEPLRRKLPGDAITLPSLSSYWLEINTGVVPLDDPLVRQAFAMAVDKEELVTIAQEGLDSPAYGGLLPPNFPGHSADINLPFDPLKARQLLTQAGFNDGQGFPSLTLTTYGYKESLGELLRRQWQEHLNLDIGMEIYPLDEYFRKQSEFTLFIHAWTADFLDPVNFLLHALEATWSWRGEEYTNLVNQAQEILKRERRIKMFRQVERILVKEAYVVPLFYPLNHWLVKPWVIFHMPQFSSGLFFDFKDVIIKPH